MSLSTAPSTAPLDLHGGIPDPRPENGCRRWPEHLKLLNRETGELFEGRCRATNRCAYCARLFAVETSEMLLLDAVEDAPALYVVLTARNHLEKRDCHRHLSQLRKWLKRRAGRALGGPRGIPKAGRSASEPSDEGRPGG